MNKSLIRKNGFLKWRYFYTNTYKNKLLCRTKDVHNLNGFRIDILRLKEDEEFYHPPVGKIIQGIMTDISQYEEIVGDILWLYVLKKCIKSNRKDNYIKSVNFSISLNALKIFIQENEIGFLNFSESYNYMMIRTRKRVLLKVVKR